MPNLDDQFAFLEFDDASGTRRRFQVRLPRPVPNNERTGTVHILGYRARWDDAFGDIIRLEQPVSALQAEMIRMAAQHTVQHRTEPAPQRAADRWARGGIYRFDRLTEPAPQPAPENRWASGAIYRPDRVLYDDELRMGIERHLPQVDWTAQEAPPRPPSAPRCACGDRLNRRWEHHSGGCTYLDPDVSDYHDEGMNEDAEDD